MALFLIGFVLAELRRALSKGKRERRDNDLPPLIGWKIPCKYKPFDGTFAVC